MTKDLQTITVKTPLSEVGEIFTRCGFHHLPVLSGKKLVGLLSFTDLMRVSFTDSFGVTAQQAVYELLDHTLSVEQVMTSELVTIDSKNTIREAAEILAKGKFHALPVVDGEELVGMVTSSDLLEHLLEQY
jgi:CBS domain-containing protein